MSARKLNDVERKLHQAALVKAEKVVTSKELESLVPDANARLAAVNFLLGTGLLVLLKGTKGEILYRAVTQEELNVKKGLDSEEVLVLDRIRAAGAEGIWTKHIKSKTQLHQTVVDRCLKSLTKRQLIKTVPDVRFPTRKIYILSSLQPAAELTGGPWYTDKELDTEFIKLLSDVCLKIVQDTSFPRARGEHGSRRLRPLYPLSHTSYASSQQVLTFLQKSRVTETVLTVEHVESLLNVLVLDGKIERLPAFRTSWKPDEDVEDTIESVKVSAAQAPRKRKLRPSSETDDARPENARKRGASVGSSQKKRKLEGSGNSSDSDDDPFHPPHSTLANAAQYDGGVVYRAVREERILSLGIGQAPCQRCPRFDFCNPFGPVNPQECVYYDAWLAITPVKDGQA